MYFYIRSFYAKLSSLVLLVFSHKNSVCILRRLEFMWRSIVLSSRAKSRDLLRLTIRLRCLHSKHYVFSRLREGDMTILNDIVILSVTKDPMWRSTTLSSRLHVVRNEVKRRNPICFLIGRDVSIPLDMTL